MDPMSYIAAAPAEWMPLLFCMAILLKAFQSWIGRGEYKRHEEFVATKDDDIKPKPGAVG